MTDTSSPPASAPEVASAPRDQRDIRASELEEIRKQQLAKARQEQHGARGAVGGPVSLEEFRMQQRQAAAESRRKQRETKDELHRYKGNVDDIVEGKARRDEEHRKRKEYRASLNQFRGTAHIAAQSKDARASAPAQVSAPAPAPDARAGVRMAQGGSISVEGKVKDKAALFSPGKRRAAAAAAAAPQAKLESPPEHSADGPSLVGDGAANVGDGVDVAEGDWQAEAEGVPEPSSEEPPATEADAALDMPNDGLLPVEESVGDGREWAEATKEEAVPALSRKDESSVEADNVMEVSGLDEIAKAGGGTKIKPVPEPSSEDLSDVVPGPPAVEESSADAKPEGALKIVEETKAGVAVTVKETSTDDAKEESDQTAPEGFSVSQEGAPVPEAKKEVVAEELQLLTTEEKETVAEEKKVELPPPAASLEVVAPKATPAEPAGRQVSAVSSLSKDGFDDETEASNAAVDVPMLSKAGTMARGVSALSNDSSKASMMRHDVDFSFGLIVRREKAPGAGRHQTPDVYNAAEGVYDERVSTVDRYMSAAANVVEEYLAKQGHGRDNNPFSDESRVERVVFDPEFPPHVLEIVDDVHYAPPASSRASGRVDSRQVVRRFVRAAVPIFVHKGNVALGEQVRRDVLDALRMAVMDGSFVEAANRQPASEAFASSQ